MNKTQASTELLDVGMRIVVAFTKMQALGNDFVFIDENDLAVSDEGRSIIGDQRAQAQLARRLCDRHEGIGADGLILVRKPGNGDCAVGWTYLNSDGSTSAMCGNGLRCMGLYAVMNKLASGEQFCVETALGPVEVKVIDEDIITSDLGVPVLESGKIPVSGDAREKVVREQLTVGSHTLTVTCVSMGNPHCVIFDSGLKEDQWTLLSPQIQTQPMFPEGVNVEFVHVISPTHARVFVWERGCGPTRACASGAAAVLVAGVLEGRLQRAATIDLPGGSLRVWWSDTDEHVRITGPAHVSYRGVFDLGRYAGGRG